MSQYYLEIANLTATFYQSLDTENHEAVVGLFAEDGAWYRGKDVFQGAKSIGLLLAERDSARISCHQISNLVLSPICDGALKAQYYLTVYSNQAKQLIPSVILLMTDELVFVSDEVWRIKSKRSQVHLRLP